MFDIERGIWPLRVDRIQVGQVISNLVGNAVDAMAKGSYVTILARNRDYRDVPSVSLPLGTDSRPIRQGRYVEITVKDRGSGIPPDIRAPIFALGAALALVLLQNLFPAGLNAGPLAPVASLLFAASLFSPSVAISTSWRASWSMR